ncbi:uncharacterized protein LOC144437368 [Glandiceps talaboti]
MTSLDAEGPESENIKSVTSETFAESIPFQTDDAETKAVNRSIITPIYENDNNERASSDSQNEKANNTAVEQPSEPQPSRTNNACPHRHRCITLVATIDREDINIKLQSKFNKSFDIKTPKSITSKICMIWMSEYEDDLNLAVNHPTIWVPLQIQWLTPTKVTRSREVYVNYNCNCDCTSSQQ